MFNADTTAPSSVVRRPRRVRGALAGLALLAVTALTPGCATHLIGIPEPVTNPSPTVSQVPTPTSTPSSSSDDGNRTSSSSADAEIDELLEDIDSAARITDQFWADHWGELFTNAYVAPQVVGLYSADSDDVPTCAGEPLPSDNAVYCSAGDFVAWDTGLMAHGLDIGSSWAYLVVAHEWGHAVLDQLDPVYTGPDEELQADCLAGATLYGAEADGTITMGDGTVKELVDGLNTLSDETPWTATGDHGDSFERINAFNTGRLKGVYSCLAEDS